MKILDTNHVADFRDLCPPQSGLCRRLSPCIVNSIRATQTGLSRTCHVLCRKHLDMSGKFQRKSA